MKKFTAKVVEATAKSIGSSGLSVVRKILPISMKRRLSRLVSSEIPLTDAIIVTKDGHKFEAISEPVFLHIRLEGDYERELSALARALVRPGDTAVDVGANFGWYSMLLAKAVGPAGQVFSFEPNAAIYPTFLRNIELNGYGERIVARPYGIGAVSGTATLVAGTKELAIGYVKAGAADAGGNAGATIEIKALDDLLQDKIGQIAYIKIDVEGFEPQVMRGAEKIFTSADLPVVQMEYNVEALERQNVDLEAFAAQLQNLDYTIAVESGGRLRTIPAINAKANENLFFLPRRGRFSDRAARLV